MKNPFEGYRITSPFGMRKDPFDGTQKLHTGIDLVKFDKAPLPAFMGGVVVHAKEGVTGSGFGGFGNVVAIQDVNGSIQFYAHLSSILVKVGDVIKAGQIVGLQGNTGHSAGSHLHFEVRTSHGSGFGFGFSTEPTAYLQKYMAVEEVKVEVKPVPPVITIPQEDEDDMKLLDNEWKMLVDSLNGWATKGLITDTKWVDLAKNKTLTLSQLAYLNTIVFTRQNGIKV